MPSTTETYASLRRRWTLLLINFLVMIVVVGAVFGGMAGGAPSADAADTPGGAASGGSADFLIAAMAATGWIGSVAYVFLRIRPRGTAEGWIARPPLAVQSDGLVALALAELPVLLTTFVLARGNLTVIAAAASVTVAIQLLVVHPAVLAAYRVAEAAGLDPAAPRPPAG